MEAQDRARGALEDAKTEREQACWQGVKDGLRRGYAILTNYPQRSGLSGNTPNWRPPAANDTFIG